MGIQLFLIQPKNVEDDAAREAIAQFIGMRDGFILMSTSHGSIIAAFDEGLLDAVKAHHEVEFASGVMLDPAAPGAAALQQVFAQNIAAQLTERGVAPGAGSASSRTPAPTYPPGYRPLRWPAHGKGGD